MTLRTYGTNKVLFISDEKDKFYTYCHFDEIPRGSLWIPRHKEKTQYIRDICQDIWDVQLESDIDFYLSLTEINADGLLRKQAKRISLFDIAKNNSVLMFIGLIEGNYLKGNAHNSRFVPVFLYEEKYCTTYSSFGNSLGFESIFKEVKTKK